MRTSRNVSRILSSVSFDLPEIAFRLLLSRSLNASNMVSAYPAGIPNLISNGVV